MPPNAQRGQQTRFSGWLGCPDNGILIFAPMMFTKIKIRAAIDNHAERATTVSALQAAITVSVIDCCHFFRPRLQPHRLDRVDMGLFGKLDSLGIVVSDNCSIGQKCRLGDKHAMRCEFHFGSWLLPWA